MRDLLAKAPVLAFAKDLEGRYLFGNETWLRLCNYTQEQVLGRTDAELFPPDFAAEFVKNDRLVAESGQTIQVEERAPSDGQTMVGVSTKFPLRDASGAVVAVGGIAIDVTEKHEAQLALAASERRYRGLVEHSPESLLILNVQSGFFVEANANAERLFGLPRHAFLGASPAVLSPPLQPDGRTSLEAAGSYIEAALRGEFPVFDWLHQAADGELLPCRIWLSRFDLPEGPGVRASILDMREIVRMRSVLERTRAQLDAVQDALPQVVVVYEPLTQAMVHCNRTYQMLAPQVPLWVLAADACQTAQAKGASRQEVFLSGSQGADRIFQVEVSVFGRETEESPLRLLLVGTDVTEQRQLDQQLRESRRLESLGRLAGGVAHDFNNLLTIILGSAEFLEAHVADDAQAKADVDMLLAATKKAQQITAQLLTFARSRRGNEERLVVDEVVMESLPLLQRVLGEGVQTRVDLGATGECIWIHRGQFEQILINLTANVRDAVRPGDTLTVASRRVDFLESEAAGDPPGSFIELRFQDSGTGMSPETIEKAFEPFFTTKGIGKGTGLGLSTVHGIAKAAGGTISIRSAPGCGSSVTILLPVSEREPSSDDHSRPAQPEGLEAPGERSEATQVRAHSILLVEDNPAVLDVNRRALLAAGHRVSVASDGALALELFHSSGPFDVIVTDIVMPVMNGFELADRIRQELPEQQFVFVSGYAEEALRERGVTPSEIDILQKPFSPQTLVERITRR